MSEAERQLSEDRDNRIAARALFDRRLKQVRDDLDARGIGGRIKDSAVETGEAAVDQGIEIARENKGVIAGVVVALALWFFRNPLLAIVRHRRGTRQSHVHDDDASRAADDE